MRHCFVPPYLLQRLAETDSELAAGCARALEIDARLRASRDAAAGRAPEPPRTARDAWVVHSADNRESLPGRRVRAAGEPASGDLAVDEAAAGIEASLALAADLGRLSYDGAGATVLATVHFGRDYVNAFWDGTQLVFGDGDGRIFERFTKPVDVLGHEFAHAVTEHTAGLFYRDQPGALNESASDVFAACLKQRLLGQEAAEGDWLIGAGLFRPGVAARALRDMARPGTAYDDPALGRDPQVGHLDDYVVTREDNGGVHLNSGIPNRAFHLAAVAIGGAAWQGAGRIWWSALTGGEVSSDTDFSGFAAATVAVADDLRTPVEEAWAAVGVALDRASEAESRWATSSAAAGPTDWPTDWTDWGGPAGPGSDLPPDAPTTLVVRRSGGLLGRTAEASRDLTAPDAGADEARRLLARVDLRGLPLAEPMPDMYVYTFEVPGRAPIHVSQQHLTPELRRLVEIVLEA